MVVEVVTVILVHLHLLVFQIILEIEIETILKIIIGVDHKQEIQVVDRIVIRDEVVKDDEIIMIQDQDLVQVKIQIFLHKIIILM